MLFILVPSLSPTGPVKGAIALANALSSSISVTLVSLKKGEGADSPIDNKVHITLLEDKKWPLKKLFAFRDLLNEANKTGRVAVISYCFSADMVNMLCKDLALICSSVRSNLFNNYRMDYGYPGLFLAFFHLIALRRFHHVIAMSEAMAIHVHSYSRRQPVVIGNFVDERHLDEFQSLKEGSNGVRFVFLGSLSNRKKPELVLRAVKTLSDHGENIHLDMIGDGPLSTSLHSMAIELGIAQLVKFHGQVKAPYSLLARADFMILPSLSEGVPRAALESLYLGVPVILRNIDGNSELITPQVNGMLFDKDEELANVMQQAVIWTKQSKDRGLLLPDKFRQEIASEQHLQLIGMGRDKKAES